VLLWSSGHTDLLWQREFFKKWPVQGRCYLACPNELPSARTDIVKRQMSCSVLVVLYWKSWGREAIDCLAWSSDERSKSLETGHWLQRKSLTVCPVTRTQGEVMSLFPVTQAQNEALTLCVAKPEKGEALTLCPVKPKYGEAMSLCFIRCKLLSSQNNPV